MQQYFAKSMLVGFTSVLLVICTLQASSASETRTTRRRYSAAELARALVRDYDHLNGLLVTHVQSSDPIPNLLEALDWLKVASGESEPDDELKPEDINESHVPSLILFSSMLRLIASGENHCNLHGHEIIKHNVEATGTDLMRPDLEVGPLRRIDQVVRSVALKHSQDCRLEYPHMFSWILHKSENTKTFASVDRLLTDILQEVPEPKLYDWQDTRWRMAQRARQLHELRLSKYAIKIYEFVKAYVEDDEESERCLEPQADERVRNKWIVDKNCLREALDKHAFAKCRNMIKLAENILPPAFYDQKLYPLSEKYRPYTTDSGLLMLWLEYYRICDRMINADKDIIVNNIANYIWQRYGIKQTISFGKLFKSWIP